jgi:hypothetical protein
MKFLHRKPKLTSAQQPTAETTEKQPNYLHPNYRHWELFIPHHDR